MKKVFFFLFLLVEINFADPLPKNIIIMIGDGMGVSYISASVLSIEKDPFRRFTSSGFSVTCAADKLITDSAASATAIATGYKTNNHAISVNPETNEPMTTIFEVAKKLKKATGIVVTSSFTHATPAAFFSHVEERNMELEIARQAVQSGTDVVIGGGTKFLMPKLAGGDRTDGLNLITELRGLGYNYYDSYDKLKNTRSDEKFYAIFESDGLLKASDRDYTLGDLTRIALDYLSKQANGFIMMIEGSQIDWAGHANNDDYLLSEMKDFNTAVNAALDFAEQEGETLVLITADHETGGMNIVGGDVDGHNIDLKFSTGGHTADLVPIFAKGPGEENFRGVMDNFMIGRKLFKLLDVTL